MRTEKKADTPRHPVQEILSDLSGPHPWIPGAAFQTDGTLAVGLRDRLVEVIKLNQNYLLTGELSVNRGD